MNRFRVGFVAIGSSALLALGWVTLASAAETQVGPATIGDVSAGPSGVRVGPSTVNDNAARPTNVNTGGVTVGTDGSARVGPSQVCVERRPDWFFGEVCNLGVDQEGARAAGSGARVGGLTLCYNFFPPGIFCQAETGFAAYRDSSGVHVEPTAATGKISAGGSGVSMTEESECYEFGFIREDLACVTVGRAAAGGGGGVQTTPSEVCVLPAPDPANSRVPCQQVG